MTKKIVIFLLLFLMPCIGHSACTFSIAYPAGSYQTTPTPDGYGQVVHPSVVYFAAGWGTGSYEYWLVATPYANSDDDRENPCIYASHDGSTNTWVVPSGLTNPIYAPALPANNADAHLFYDTASDQLWCYFMQTDNSYVKWYRMTTSNGVSWNAPQECFTTGYPAWTVASASVVKVGSTYYMWYVNHVATPNTLEYMTSSDGLTFSNRVLCSLSGSFPDTKEIWHPEVKYLSDCSTYLMVAATTPGTDNKPVVCSAVSTDMINWTISSSVLLTGPTSGWDRMMYKTCFIELGSVLRMWYSAYPSQADNTWHIGYTTSTIAGQYVEPSKSLSGGKLTGGKTQ